MSKYYISGMKGETMEDITNENRVKKLRELDEEDLRLIDSGISLLAARHKLEDRTKKEADPVLLPAT